MSFDKEIVCRIRDGYLLNISKISEKMWQQSHDPGRGFFYMEFLSISIIPKITNDFTLIDRNFLNRVKFLASS
jgi:hypothetical protein